MLRAVGKRLGDVRRQRGWTQERLAEAVGIGAVSLSRLEGGHRALSLSTLAQIAAVLDVRLVDLLDVDVPVPAAKVEPGEQELVATYRGLDEPRRDLALRLVREVGR
ncbi:MAG: helix-turn-helix transcriptional regulator [Deltaproteobacteria bacterium]|nr:helix-turn-helix transcriptional regulator [Deltaproteobacteria bacterium]